jgi:nucleolin
LDGSTWQDTQRWLKIELAREKEFNKKAMGSGGVRPEGCDTVFIGNLPWDVTEEQLRILFGECGEVNQVRFATAEDGGFRGFGHVQFTDGESTDAAVKLHGSDVNGRAIRVDYAPPRIKPAFGGDGGGRGRGDGGRGRGGRDGGRGRGGGRDGGRGRGRGDAPINKNKGAIVAGTGKKMSFDDE